MGYIKEIRIRLEKLHQEKLEPALAADATLLLNSQEIQDLCEFMDSFLYGHAA